MRGWILKKCGDSFGKAFVQWWGIYPIPDEDPDAPLREDASAIVADDGNCNVGAFKRHWKPQFPKAQRIRCIPHVLNIVGMAFQEHTYLFLLRESTSKRRSFLKGKKDMRQRCSIHDPMANSGE